MRIVKKLKNGIKKFIEKKVKPKVRKLKTIGKKKRVVNKPVEELVAVGMQETTISNAKFSHPETQATRRPGLQELPGQYDCDRIVLQVRDVRWLHSYWELRNQTWDNLRNTLGEKFHSAKRVLRVYEITNVIFNGSNANSFFDIQINDFASSWYIDTNGPGKSWVVDLGLMLSDGRFITIVRSNVVQTTHDGPSAITDEEWMIPDHMFARLYGLGFGFGKSSPVGGAWQERIKQGIFSSGVSSSPVRKQPKERSFWMKVDCELIVYGATEPDALVTVQGKPITLRSDGTFTMRYYLPDGKQVIPVKGVSADGIEERTITPIVSRETKNNALIKESL